MDFIEKYLQSKIFLFFIIAFLCITNIFSVGYFLNKDKKAEECYCEECPKMESGENSSTTKIKVDIKGYVKNPGVYELENGAIVNELIELAGGLKTNGTTEDINLSKELKNEDVVIVSSKAEITKQNKISVTKTTSTGIKNTASISSSTNSNNNSSANMEDVNKKISINRASKEELMTLNGIGEAKAESIIAYRNNNSFKEISEIMNVSGIGESIYDKIKDFITI